MSALVQIPFHNTSLSALSDEGKPLVSLRHMCESIGLDIETQRRKLAKKAWAVAVLKPATGSDGKTYQMHMIDRRTMTMWLATIEPSRVNPEARPLLEQFQNEAADALDAYFHEGIALNPRAIKYDEQARVLESLRNLIDPAWLEAKAKIVAARALGEVPEIAPADMPLYSEAYLNEKPELTKAEAKRIRSTFGRRVATQYRAEHGKDPMKSPGEVGSRVRAINAYTEADRWIFDKVWDSHYAAKYAVQLAVLA